MSHYIDDEMFFPDYPSYPPDEDVYNKLKKESEINPEDPATLKTENIKEEFPNELNKRGISTENDLDVPGSELDDADEIIGSEDEENNFYSIGGDNHNNLEENQEEGDTEEN